MQYAQLYICLIDSRKNKNNTEMKNKQSLQKTNSIKKSINSEHKTNKITQNNIFQSIKDFLKNL